MSSPTVPTPSPQDRPYARVAVPFARDEPRQGWAATCPTCGLVLAFIADELLRQQERTRPAAFAVGPHVCRKAGE